MLDLYPNHAAAVQDCETKRIFTVAVTTTPKAWPRNDLLASATRHVRAALGFHPQLVSERSPEFALWEQYLPHARYVGEVGLDAGPRFFRSLQLQKEVFERILRDCARLGGKILSVHSVRAAQAVLDLVEAHLPPSRGRVVLHWFTGSAADARRAVALGCYFSVNAKMLDTGQQLEVVAAIPLNRLLTESDGPFIKTNGRPTQPADVARVVDMIARTHRRKAPEIAAAIRDNLRALVSE